MNTSPTVEKFHPKSNLRYPGLHRAHAPPARARGRRLPRADARPFREQKHRAGRGEARGQARRGVARTAAAAGQTALVTEAARQSLTSTTVSSNTVEYVAAFAAGTGTGAITEAGVLNAASGGTMLCRTVFSVVNKGASDSMTITWTITIS